MVFGKLNSLLNFYSLIDCSNLKLRNAPENPATPEILLKAAGSQNQAFLESVIRQGLSLPIQSEQTITVLHYHTYLMIQNGESS